MALGGSRGAGAADSESDCDLYVYAVRDLPVPFRRALAGPSGEVGNRFWEHGDEWIDDATGARIDVMYRSPGWIEDRLDQVLTRFEASLGYTTCFWFNVLHSTPLADPRGWYGQLRQRATVPYPAPLRRAIIDRNLPVVGRNQSCYRRQIELALARNDAVSVNHRLTALLASVFDIWFAAEEKPHPGEKRLLTHLPPEWAAAVRAVLASPTLAAIDHLIDLTEAAAARVPPIAPSLEHFALYVSDLERARAFFERWFGAVAGPRYDSRVRPFASYFLTLAGGPRLEIMSSPVESPRPAHLAVCAGSREAVDALTSRMAAAGAPLLSAPRTTGDGCYESVVADPDGNPIEITAG